MSRCLPNSVGWFCHHDPSEVAPFYTSAETSERASDKSGMRIENFVKRKEHLNRSGEWSLESIESLIL